MSDPTARKPARNLVTRPDGKLVNVARKTGQLFFCLNGCCCGHADKSVPPVLIDLYNDEWERRRLRNKVHLTSVGCLGPCPLANVAMLLFDGRSLWFHSMNTERQVLALYDYIEQMLTAQAYLPAPATLTDYQFTAFNWQPRPGEEHLPPTSSGELVEPGGFLFLTQADTDLLALSGVAARLGADFPRLQAHNVSGLKSDEDVDAFLASVLPEAEVVILRLLGGRGSFAHGFERIVEHVEAHDKWLLCLPGTDTLDPELTAVSNVGVPVTHEALAYLQHGGLKNYEYLLRFLSDHLLMTGYGYDAPEPQPRHGVYHPDIPDGTLDAWHSRTQALGYSNRPTLGVLFYRSHLLSGNIDFVDALVRTGEAMGANVLPVYAYSLKETDDAPAEPDGGPLTGSQSPLEPDGRPSRASGRASLTNDTVRPERVEGRGEPNNAEALAALHTEAFEGRGDASAEIPAALRYFLQPDGHPWVDVLISTMSFAMGNAGSAPEDEEWSTEVLRRLDVPVLQAITASMSSEQWELSLRGLAPIDTGINVAIPEFDGRIITVPISFKDVVEPAHAGACEIGCGCDQPTLGSPITRYVPREDRVRRVIGQALRLSVLRRKPNAEKRIAFMLTNYSAKASRIANAVGLDSPASMLRVLHAMREAGYQIAELPPDGDALLQALIDRGSYDLELLTDTQLATMSTRIPPKQYQAWFDALPAKNRIEMAGQWQAPPGGYYVDETGHLALAGLEFDNVFVAIQPPRGYNMDPAAIYHMPDLPPPHPYHALYRWLATPTDESGWGADAVVHLGKHGTLEWLPGKGVGVSQECYPDLFLGDLPLVYPFIINNPGEGAQAKRRTHAVIVDHLTPPMTTAEGYGELEELTRLVDEYYQLEKLDPSKLPLLQQQIWELIQQAHLDSDLGKLLNWDANAHTHEWDPQFHEDGVPYTISDLTGRDFAHLVENINGYLCELTSAQIRDGLHILGQPPHGEQLIDTLQSLVRVPNLHIPSLREAIAACFGLDLSVLLDDLGRPFEHEPLALAAAWNHPVPTHADALEAIDALGKRLLQALAAEGFASAEVDDTIVRVLSTNRPPLSLPLPGGEDSGLPLPGGEKPGLPLPGGEEPLLPSLAGMGWERVESSETESAAPELGRPVPQYAPTGGAGLPALRQTLVFICDDLLPRLQRTNEEITHLLHALEGGYVPAGPSGAPTRGMAHVLPTGRNFYTVDPRGIPSEAAWKVGQMLADALLTRHQEDEAGTYPESVGISIWGTSAMRTHGDDVAEVFALLGVRPRWQPESRRLLGVDVVPLGELGRPRIDVVCRISGFFRDAFPHLISLLDEAFQVVAHLDEPAEQNFVRKHFLAERERLSAAGASDQEAEEAAGYRIFGSKPGSYGAGILPLIDEGNWKDASDFAQVYVNWGGYAYTREQYGIDARPAFQRALSGVQVAVKNQDNREHDIFDSDDYLQYHGGMIAAIRALTGKQPRRYFGDSADPQRPRVRDLKEEALRVFRTRVANPKWIASVQRHGYKGALEMAATVDYLFGYDATSDVVDDWMYAQVAERYVLDPALREFFQRSNPWALRDMAARLLEAAERGLWAEPGPLRDALQAAYLALEGDLEGRAERPAVGRPAADA